LFRIKFVFRQFEPWEYLIGPGRRLALQRAYFGVELSATSQQASFVSSNFRTQWRVTNPNRSYNQSVRRSATGRNFQNEKSARMRRTWGAFQRSLEGSHFFRTWRRGSALGSEDLSLNDQFFSSLALSAGGKSSKITLAGNFQASA
jgi:hypothetical protein